MERVVVITGPAQGMGREVARILDGKGHAVAGFDVDGEGLESLKGEMRHPERHHLVTMDITDRPGIRAFRDVVLERYGKVDVVLSNVGIGFFGPFEEIDLEAALKCLEVNVIGAAAVFQAFIPSMRERGEGKLVAMSSLVGQIPFPFESVYTASKFALEGLILAFRYEVEPFGIRTAIIEPAQVSTGFAAKIHKLPPEGSPYRERVKRFIDRDNELIKTAPDPVRAAEMVVKVLEAEKPPLFTRFSFRDSFFITINKWLPTRVRDAILVNFMRIKV
ncbi:SDR family NAD(P)-dependent oxidoreductase [Candidatus Solincola tengchongensis]|uniref:SDR family NAD(P)-dependent oxidoreductase n=1 Tax=Candidatus Solincola tengchongensis TaxID=2900693 RepID=UPI00257CAADA|nr:SDR family NAD(P)-dependent oxidoreductase [Candidatus Solincola tengchongensis]